VRWNSGTVEQWNGGTGEQWNSGTVERWNGGTGEQGNRGTVERWNVIIFDFAKKVGTNNVAMNEN